MMARTTHLYIRRFFQNTYYGGRLVGVQCLLLGIANEIALLFGNRWELKYLGLEFFAIFLYTLLYTMLYYWSKAFASLLHPLQRIIITFIPYALIFYWAVIEGVEANWRMAVIFQGLFAFLFSLSTISIEYALKAWLPTRIKRIASIVWNTLTIFLIIIFLAVFIVEAYQIK